MPAAVPSVDSLTLEEKLGQVFLSRSPREFGTEGRDLLERGLVSGFINNGHLTADEISQLQERSPIPLLVASDMEMGAQASDMSAVTPMPCQMAIAAFAGDAEAYEWAAMAAREAREAGINYVLGPVGDMVLDRTSTFVNLRSFGDDLERVASLAAAAVRGYQDNGLLVALKHYPGFGGSPYDAHIKMCELDIPRDVFLERELRLYRAVMEKVDLSGVMSGHIMVPSVDGHDCATTSGPLVGLLRDAGFGGVLITDSLAMKGLKTRVSSECAHGHALAAGHDMILADYELPPTKALEYIRDAFESGLASEQQLDASVARILDAKRRLFAFPPAKPDHEANLKRSLAFSRKAITLAGELPRLDPAKPYLVVISEEANRAHVQNEIAIDGGATGGVEEILAKALPKAKCVRISEYPDAATIGEVLKTSLAYSDVLVFAYYYPGSYKGTASLTGPLVALVQGLEEKIAAFVLFGSPFAADVLPPFPCTIYAYLGGFVERAAVEVLLGRVPPEGRLPVQLT